MPDMKPLRPDRRLPRPRSRTPVLIRCVLTMLLTQAIVTMAGLAAAASSLPALVPQPVRIAAAGGAFELNSKTPVIAGPGALAKAVQLAAALREITGLPLEVREDGPAQPSIRLTLDPAVQPTLGPEGYRLAISPRGVTLVAAGEAGLFYGGVTLMQLPPVVPSATVGTTAAVPAERRTLPGVEIEDYPRFRWRGLLLDPARHFLPIEFVRRFVDLMAMHKLNTLQLHLTDDQGWRLEIGRYPRLTTVGSIRKESPRRGNASAGDGTPYGPFFYTQDQIRELVAYAAARHVTIVPEIEIPGHFRAALTAYPEYSCTGGPFEVRTRWGVEPDILCAGNDKAFAFVQDILTEVIAVFPSEFIHTGGDEAPRDRWKACPKCQARIRALGLKNEAALQSDLTARLSRFVAGKGRRLVGWDEILEGGLAPGATVMSWRGWEGGITSATLGHDVVMSPTTHCYLDYAQAKGPGEPESIGGFIPLDKVYAFEPVPSAVPADKAHHILGAQGNIWGEFLFEPKDVEYFAFPRAIALAEVVWSPTGGRSYAGFLDRLAAHLPRLDARRVNYRRLTK